MVYKPNGLPAMYVEPKLIVPWIRYNSAEPLVKLTFMDNLWEELSSVTKHHLNLCYSWEKKTFGFWDMVQNHQFTDITLFIISHINGKFNAHVHDISAGANRKI